MLVSYSHGGITYENSTKAIDPTDETQEAAVVRALFLALLLLAASPAFAAEVFVPEHPAVVNTWAELCAMMECGDTTTAPMVIFLDTGNALGVYYHGVNVVFVTEGCLAEMADRDLCQAIVMHEMTHYLIYDSTGLSDGCFHEEVAWSVYNAYVTQVARPDLLRYDWRNEYPECGGGGS